MDYADMFENHRGQMLELYFNVISILFVMDFKTLL